MEKCISIDCRYTVIIDSSAEQEPSLRGERERIHFSRIRMMTAYTSI